jgi:hypothetical protein
MHSQYILAYFILSQPANSQPLCIDQHRPHGPPHGKQRSNGQRKDTTPGPIRQPPRHPHHNPAASSPKTLINPSSPYLSPPPAPKPFLPPSLLLPPPLLSPERHEASERRRRFPRTQRGPRWPLRWRRGPVRRTRRRGPVRRRWRVPRRGPSGRGRRCVVSPSPRQVPEALCTTLFVRCR